MAIFASMQPRATGRRARRPARSRQLYEARVDDAALSELVLGDILWCAAREFTARRRPALGWASV